MSHIYTFCPTSEALLEKCIAAVPPPDVNNKWMLAFRRKNEVGPKHNLLTPEEDSPVISCDVEMKNDFLTGYDELIEVIETDPASRWDDIVQECMKNHDLFVLLAERLTAPSVERLCKHVLGTNTEYAFLENFCKLFLPNRLKREYNRLYLDFFVKVHKQHTKLFKNLIEILLQDVEIPNKMLSDFIAFLNDNEQKAFLKNISYIKLSAENFVHHLPTLLNTYKISTKSEEVQNYIFTNLVQHNVFCRNDRHYGKLFLAYLQTEKAMAKTLNVKYLRDLLENHATPFKKPCERILNDAH